MFIPVVNYLRNLVANEWYLLLPFPLFFNLKLSTSPKNANVGLTNIRNWGLYIRYCSIDKRKNISGFISAAVCFMHRVFVNSYPNFFREDKQWHPEWLNCFWTATNSRKAANTDSPLTCLRIAINIPVNYYLLFLNRCSNENASFL